MINDVVAALFTDVDPERLKQAAAEPTVKAALADLRIAMEELAKCPEQDRIRDHWETTRIELVDEIRRRALLHSPER